MKKMINVLQIDDSDIIADFVKKMISKNERISRIDRAADLVSGMNMLKQQQPDVVILDIRLPDGNGIDMLKWIKANYPQVYVIMFSNNSDMVHRVISKEYGAEKFFDKSTEFEMINEVLTELDM